MNILNNVVELNEGQKILTETKRGRSSSYARNPIVTGEGESAKVVGLNVSTLNINLLFAPELPEQAIPAVRFAVDRVIGASLGNVEASVKAGQFKTADEAARSFVLSAIDAMNKGSFGSVATGPAQSDLDFIEALAITKFNGDRAEAGRKYWAKLESGADAVKAFVTRLRADAGIAVVLKKLALDRATAAAKNAGQGAGLDDLFAEDSADGQPDF